MDHWSPLLYKQIKQRSFRQTSITFIMACLILRVSQKVRGHGLPGSPCPTTNDSIERDLFSPNTRFVNMLYS